MRHANSLLAEAWYCMLLDCSYLCGLLGPPDHFFHSRFPSDILPPHIFSLQVLYIILIYIKHLPCLSGRFLHTVVRLLSCIALYYRQIITFNYSILSIISIQGTQNWSQERAFGCPTCSSRPFIIYAIHHHPLGMFL